jgi:hypothetical protein
MKKLTQIMKESNVSSGFGVRGFGDVSGTPATNDDVENSHIDRVIQGAQEHQDRVDNFVAQHNTTTLLDEPEEDNYWSKNNDKKKGKLNEQAPVNSSGGGGIAGLGVGPQGEPGVSSSAMNRHKKENEQNSPVMTNILRRKPLDVPLVEMGVFAGHKTFKVPRMVYERAVHEKIKGKHWTKYVGDGDIGKAIREYANKNPKSPIILEDQKTGYMCFARYGRK